MYELFLNKDEMLKVKDVVLVELYENLDNLKTDDIGYDIIRAIIITLNHDGILVIELSIKALLYIRRNALRFKNTESIIKKIDTVLSSIDWTKEAVW